MINLFVGLASGLASATLSLSLLSGSMLAVLLFMFAPLPILLAAIGWNHRAGLVGALVASAFLFVITGFDTTRGYAASIGLPAWWLGYLALLGRPLGERPEDGFDWYPVGRLVAWAAALGAGLVLVTILLSGSLTSYQDVLRTTFEAYLRLETGTPEGEPLTLPGGGDAERLTNIAVAALPPAGAAVWTANMLFNIWAAGRIARMSDRLIRPWPDLTSFTLPGIALPIFLAGILGTWIPGVGFMFGIVGASFSIAFAALGLAVIHTGTRGMGGRRMILFATYLLLAVQAWTAILIAALGALEQVFQIRARLANRRSGKPPLAPR
jgi:hypothetical protein